MASPSPTPTTPLQFSEPISWKPGRPPIATAALMKRLKQLFTELCKLDQETVDRESLSTAARDLCSPALMQHKDKGVKAYTACGLAEMLRLHAPDAPYTGGQLRDIFDLFVKQLRYISTPDSPYNTQYIHLLDSLSTIKSIVLIIDIPNGDNLILQLFTSFFDIGAKPGIPRQIEFHMSDILVQLVAESASLPSEVVDIIVAQFLRANPVAVGAPLPTGNKKTPGEHGGKQTSIREHMAPPPPAYNMARVICTSLACVDKMARHICQYFSEVILDASPSSRPHHHRRSSLSPDPHSSPEPHGQHEPTDDDIKELTKAHLLVKELWRAAPSVLQNVIPQLEQELLAENVQLRLLATETIGEMASTSPSPPLSSGIMGGQSVAPWGGTGGGSGSFPSACPASWKLWLGRVNDKSWVVRTKWVECATRVLSKISLNTAPGQAAAQALIPLIADKLNDTDERVRLATCKAIGADFDYAVVKNKLSKSNGGDKLLENLALRAKDKKHGVRVEGMRVLARMWDEGYQDIRRGDEGVVKLLGWIPGSLLETSYVNDKDVNVLLDRVMWEVLLPLDYPLGCLEAGKKKKVVANGKGKEKSAEMKKGKGKEKEAAAKKVSSTTMASATRNLRDKKSQNRHKDSLDFLSSSDDDSLSDPPSSDEEDDSASDSTDSSSESSSDVDNEVESNENQQPQPSQNSTLLTHDHNRAIRLLHLAHNLSPRSLRALLALASRQLSYSAVLNPFLDAARNYTTTGSTLSTTTTGGDAQPQPSQTDTKARLTKLIDWLANQFPDPTRARDHLWKWVKLGDRRGWALVKGMLSVDAGWTQVVGNINEVVKRIEKTPGGSGQGGILETIVPLLYRSALLLWNKSHVPTIVAMSKEAAAGGGQKSAENLSGHGEGIDNGLACTANLLLKEMSGHLPAVFKAHIASLTTIIQDSAPPIPGSKKAASAATKDLPRIDPSIVDTLSALSMFARKYPQDVPKDRKLHQALFALATSHLSTPQAAKHAVRVLMSAAMERKEMYAADLVQKCITEWEYGGEGFIVRLGAIAEMVLVAPQAVVGERAVVSRIKQICAKECLTQVREPGGATDPEWTSESLLSDEGKAKILAVKTLVNMLRANPASAELAESVLIKLLKNILAQGGEISPNSITLPTPKAHRAWLRLVAANSVLKLAAQEGRLDECVSPQIFNVVALTTQDSRALVRLRFLGRLKKLLAAGRLGARWYAVVFLVAHDPEVREETAVWIRARAKAIAAASASATSTSTPSGKKSLASANIMEIVLARLISLLAHHPDFPPSLPSITGSAPSETALKELLDMGKYLAYFIRAVVTAENIGVVWYIAGYLKRVSDGIDASKSENVYVLSELAQALCRRWKEMHEGWTIEAWPGKVALPKGLFVNMQGEREVEGVRKRVFLPGEVDGKMLEGLLRERRGRGERGVNVNANGEAAVAGHGKKRKSDGPVGTGVAGVNKKRRQSKGTGGAAGDGEEGREESKKTKTPRKKRISLAETEATPKTPKRTPKRKRKNGDDDDGDTRDAEARMTTVERRRSGRVVSKVIYAEDDENTGEESERENSEDDTGEGESGNDDNEEEGGSGDEHEHEQVEEDEDEHGGDMMDVDDPDPGPEPQTKTNTRRGARGKILPKVKEAKKAKSLEVKKNMNAKMSVGVQTKKKGRRGAGKKTGDEKEKEEMDGDGDEVMSDVSELTEFESEKGGGGEVQGEGEEISGEDRVIQEGGDGDENVEQREVNVQETLEQALSIDQHQDTLAKNKNRKVKTQTQTPPRRVSGRRGGAVNGSTIGSSAVKGGEGEREKGKEEEEGDKEDQNSQSPVKQLVVGRATRRGGAGR